MRAHTIANCSYLFLFFLILRIWSFVLPSSRFLLGSPLLLCFSVSVSISSSLVCSLLLCPSFVLSLSHSLNQPNLLLCYFLCAFQRQTLRITVKQSQKSSSTDFIIIWPKEWSFARDRLLPNICDRIKFVICIRVHPKLSFAHLHVKNQTLSANFN